MTDLINILKESDDYVTLGKVVSDSEIQAAENQLGLKFSEEYKNYTRAVGSACADGHEFTGVVDVPRLSVVQATISERERNTNIPADLYVVERLGIDGIIIGQDAAGTVYQTERDGSAEKIADSLAEYLESES